MRFKLNKIKLADKKLAFTLAEVLITLAIIGIVAAMTISQLMKKIEDLEFKSAYKKAYSAAMQAVQKASGENLFLASSGQYDPNHLANFLTFESQFKVVKECFGGNNSGCWVNGEKDPNGAPVTSAYAFVDNSGMAWNRGFGHSAVIMVDTNGMKKPNRWGKDRFYWYFRTSPYSSWGFTGVPVGIVPLADNDGGVCFGTNICATKHDYFGRSWLYK